MEIIVMLYLVYCRVPGDARHRYTASGMRACETCATGFRVVAACGEKGCWAISGVELRLYTLSVRVKLRSVTWT